MKRIGALLTVTLLFGLLGCGTKDTPVAQPPKTPTKPAPTTSAAPSVTPSVTPSTSAAAAIEFTVDGAGPYQLGATLAALQSSGALAEVKTGGEVCSENTTARGTGTWTDIRLSFRKSGELYLVVNRSISIPTPSGAWLGTTLADLKKIYVGIPGQELNQGGRVAYLVTTLSSRGILFDLDDTKRVLSMAAGQSAYLKSSFTGGTDFC